LHPTYRLQVPRTDGTGSAFPKPSPAPVEGPTDLPAIQPITE